MGVLNVSVLVCIWVFGLRLVRRGFPLAFILIRFCLNLEVVYLSFEVAGDLREIKFRKDRGLMNEENRCSACLCDEVTHRYIHFARKGENVRYSV